MISRLIKTVGHIGIALRQLRYNRARTALALVGIMVAVLSVTLLFGVASGVTDTGEDLVEQTDRDLWVSGGPIEVSPTAVGGFQNPIVESHTVSEQIAEHEAVSTAIPIAFNQVYMGTDPDELDSIFGTGVTGTGQAVSIDEGEGFSGGDTHYEGGTYDGPLSEELLIDPQTAEKYNLSVGDTIHVGGTILDARQNEFEVVGISSTFSELAGTDTLTLRLSELQTLTGMAGSDRSSLIMVTLEDDTDVDEATVIADIEADHPDLEVRTNREQVTEVLEDQVVLIAGGISLVALAVLAGMFFSLNLFLSLVHQQRRELALLRAEGGSKGSLLTIALTQAIVIALLGGILGMAATPPAAAGIKRLTAAITGFDGLVNVPPEAYLIAGGIVTLFAVFGTIVSAWRLSRTQALQTLTEAVN